MPSLKNLLCYGLFLASTTTATPAPAAAVEVAVNQTISGSSSLVRRKNPHKCEVHFHVDTSSDWVQWAQYTEKWKIDVLDKPGNVMGYDFYWSNLGTWGYTNPDFHPLKVKTTHGLEIWVDGVNYKGLYRVPERENDPADRLRRMLTINYGDQHFNGKWCENWLFKGQTPSNGQRAEYDVWCEFDC